MRDPVRPGSVDRNRLQDVALLGFAAALAFFFMSFAHTNQIERVVRGDAVEPGRKTRSRFVFVQLPIGSQKSLLDHILGVLFISRHPKSQTEDSSAMLLDQ